MDTNYDKARFNMIQQQVRPWDVIDERTLEAMSEIPRERFVPDAYRSLAYADIEVPIGSGQTMLPPKVVGRMLQALNVQPDDRILQIGAGTGYVTACLWRMGALVSAIEIDPELAAAAQDNLDSKGTHGLSVTVKDAFAGPVDGRRFDVIAVTGSVPDADALTAFEELLAPGGRLFAFIGEAPVMEAVLITRGSDGTTSRAAQFETCVPALANVPEPERFVF